MEEIWPLAFIWLGLALIATLISMWLGIATALSEIFVGIIANLIVVSFLSKDFLGANAHWIAFLASAGAVILTFLAGAEIDPDVFRKKWKEVSFLGMIGFITPFIGCTAAAYYFLNWDSQASLLAGVALSTTSVAVVYAVMLELGLNKTEYGKVVLAACFVNDLATVVALGLLFSPFSWKILVFIAVALVVLPFLPAITARLFKKWDNLPAEFEAKFILMILFGFAALAVWAGSEAVLPAYLCGMVLAGSVGKNHHFIRRFRTLTLGLLTPFYFIRAGTFVSVAALIAAPFAFILLLIAKMATKFIGVYPVAKYAKYSKLESIYTTLLMSTGLTFGTIASLFGLSHGIITDDQYSYLVAAVIASAVVPTVIANRFYLPRHLIPPPSSEQLLLKDQGI